MRSDRFLASIRNRRFERDMGRKCEVDVEAKVAVAPGGDS